MRTRVNEMVMACSIFLISVYAFILQILGIVAKYVCRSNTEGSDSYFSAEHSKEGDGVVFGKSTDFLLSGLAEKGSSESETLHEISSKTEDSVSVEAELVSSNSKCQFMPREDVSGFIEEPETVEFHVEEMFVGSKDALSCSDQSLDYEISPKIQYLDQKMEENILEFDKELEVIDQVKMECAATSLCGKDNPATFDKNLRFEVMEAMDVESMEDQDFSYEIELFPRSILSTSEANRSSSFSEFKFLVGSLNGDSNKAFLEADEHRRPEDIGTNVEEEKTNQTRLDSDDEYIELEPTRVNPTKVIQESFASEVSKETKELNEPERLGPRQKDEGNSWDSDFNDENEPDVLREHQHLVQQMKMEMKNCRSGGLPTISEDCETPKVVEDLKPLNFDHKFEYKDLMEEINKFYRTYAEKMRKLDVLNFQTLQAISFLQQKDSEIFTSGKKKSGSMLKQFTLPKIWPGKVQRIHADPTLKSIVELNRDLELVYVGQICLSWEILSWLYIKAKELLPYDSQGNHSYNRTVEEFQQFQVLMQRFVEDEPFQGPRVLNYVKNRCMIRSLLQVPLIKDDCVKDKKERGGQEKDSISLEFLVRIIKESMVVLREFLHSDKSSKGHGAKIDIKEPENMALLADIITTLQKKERRLKENIRSKSCIMKMMQKQEECDQICTCEMELRLVSRVIGLSRVSRDQLIWCQNKLLNINFVSRRRVHLEPSFLLFPC